jgi:tetratricopeptide (TPR) repeat protein
MMRPARASLLAALTLLALACAPAVAPRAPTPAVAVSDPVLTEELMLRQPCTPEEAISLAGSDDEGNLRAAACYLYLAETAEDRDGRLEMARRGLEAAQEVARLHPESALAHYLSAHLAGLEAEADPLRGLVAVRHIEESATRARDLNPHLDGGGPDRILGELYLQAPGPPVSVGDPERALEHFRRAVDLAPDIGENRLGLAEALLSMEEPSSACAELHAYFTALVPPGQRREEWGRAVDLLSALCTDGF